MLAGIADDSDVRAEAHDGPFIAAARVRFAQAHHVIQCNVQRHNVGDYSIQGTRYLNRAIRTGILEILD